MKNLRFFTIPAMIIVGISLLFGCGKPVMGKEQKEEVVRDAKVVFSAFMNALEDVPKKGACGLFDLSFLNDSDNPPIKKGAGGGDLTITKKKVGNQFEADYTFTDFSPDNDSLFIFSTKSDAAEGSERGSSLKIRKATADSSKNTSSGLVNGNLFMIEKEGGKRYLIKFNAFNITNTKENCGTLESFEKKPKGSFKHKPGVTPKEGEPAGPYIKLAYQEEPNTPYIPIAIIYSSELAEQNDDFLKELLKGRSSGTATTEDSSTTTASGDSTT